MKQVFVFVDHFAWFLYFSKNPLLFRELVAFYFGCVWIVPFMFFVSLSSSENALPGGPGFVGAEKTKKRSSVVAALLKTLRLKQEEALVSHGGHSGQNKLF